jgi:TonB-dependent receptor
MISQRLSLCLTTSLITLMAAAAAAQQTEQEVVSDVIIVTGVRGSLNLSRKLEREADAFVSAVTSDDVGNFPDQNVAETLQRLPGISIDRSEGEGRFISVRGLGPEFNNVTVNGVKLGSTEKSDGSVALDIIPSDLLDSVQVVKTVTPDLDGDAIGGTIEVKALSAFDRKDAIRLRFEAGISDIRGRVNPKLSGQFTRLFDVGGIKDALGVAIAASYFDRRVQTDDLRNDEGLVCVRSGLASGSPIATDPSGDTLLDCPVDYFLRPQEIDQRALLGDRERYGGTINLEYRPDNSQSYYLRGTATRLKDTQTRFQQEIEPRRATDRRDVRAVGPRTGTMDGVDFERQIFFQEFDDKLYAVSGGGENRFGDLAVTYQGDWSRITRDGGGDRIRFRERRGLLTYEVDENSIEFTSAPGIRRAGNPSILANYDLDQVLLDREEGTDEIYSGKLDLAYGMDIGDNRLTFKVGGKYRKRDKNADVDETLIENSADIIAIGAGVIDATPTLADFPTRSIPNTRLFSHGTYPTVASVRPVLDQFAERAPVVIPPAAVNSAREDFTSSETVTSGYAMATLDVGDNTRVIAGVRIEDTKFRTQSNFVLDIEDDSAIVLPNPGGRNDYTDVLPAVILRHNSGDWQFRAAWTNAIQRPNFEDINGVQSGTQSDDGFKEIDLTNPGLEPAKAFQFDVGAAWYPNRNTAIQLTGFYKRIKDFIVDVNFNGGDIGSLPGGIVVPIPDSLTPADRLFDDIDITINGDSAEIYGIEFGYNQSFTSLPGALSGLFANLNLTYANSSSKLDLRPGAKLPFPGQPKWIGNLSVGWENDDFQVRTSINYRDRILRSVSDQAPEDVLEKSYMSVDFGLRFTFIEDIQIYFDASNLTNERDERFYRGDVNGGLFERIERFGRTFQLGVRAKF